jgi:outer membrane protein OmpA-like peptidoglycan-associated protein
MQTKKFLLLLTLTLTTVLSSFAQQPTSGYSVFDSTVIVRKRQPQQNEFLNNSYNFPAKPRNMWEIGVSGGLFNVSGDVTTVLPTFGFAAHVRKSIGYVFSLRMQYLYGTAKGLNWKASSSFKNNDAWTSNGYDTSTRTNVVYNNYKNQTQDLSLQGIFTLNNIRFHKNRTKFIMYAGAGIGATAYQTKINARNESTGDDYSVLFNKVYNDYEKKYSNRKDISNALKDGMDNSYETDAESNSKNRPKVGNSTVVFSTTVLCGVSYRLAKRINLSLENRHTFVKDDLLDGQQWQEHPGNDPALTGNWDSYNYLSLGLNFNLGSKAIEPLWWINPLDYVYGELNNPRHTKFPKPVYEDADGDGVLDQLDREPNTPAGASVDTHGVSSDSDGDGVPDYKDKQLITPTECQPVDADGVGKCPEPECCKNMKPAVTENPCPSDYPSLSYAGQNAKLTKDLKNMISAVAAKMKANPTCNIVVNGYPEASKGSQALCQQRVDAVKMQLVQKEGISADRISTKCEVGAGDPKTVDIKSN